MKIMQYSVCSKYFLHENKVTIALNICFLYTYWTQCGAGMVFAGAIRQLNNLQDRITQVGVGPQVKDNSIDTSPFIHKETYKLGMTVLLHY